MTRSAITVLAIAVVLAISVTAVEALHLRHVAAANKSLSAHAASATKQENQADPADDGVDTIRFASNALPMPAFLVNDLGGGMVSTADFRGKVVIVNFWATWCPPCREEIPEMIELANRYKGRLEIVGVSMDDSPAQDVARFAHEMGINYPVVMGSNSIDEEYGGVPALPTSYIVNRDGRVVQKHVGLYPVEVYDSEIRALLGLPVQAKIETFQDTGQIFLKNASLATELPGVDLKGLTPDQKREVLKRMNSQNCTCGCKLTIAQCRINDESCTTSKALAEKIVSEVRASAPPTTPAASPASAATVRQ